MARVCPLFSGSSGNSIYIESRGNGILIDAGRNSKQIELALKLNDINPASIKAIFLTHEHTDHISGLKVFAGKHGIQVYGSFGTINALKDKDILNGKFKFDVIDESGITESDMVVKPFRTSHDCAESFGYVINMPCGRKAAVATDLGFVSDDILSALKGCDTMVIESNHDIRMLQNGPYPYYLKRRILSEVGHLSNEACADILPKLVRHGSTRFILAHLSSENNLPELAFQTSLGSLVQNEMKKGTDFELFVAPRQASPLSSVTF